MAPSATIQAVPAPGDGAAALDYMFNGKPQDGTAAKQALDTSAQMQARKIAEEAVGRKPQTEEFRARFERYLSTAEVTPEMLNKYFAELNQVSTFLSQNKPFEAWKLLRDLQNYALIDAGVSRDLANRIQSIWTTGRATAQIDQKNTQLRGDINTANRNADLLSESVMKKQIEYQRQLTRQKAASQRWQPQTPQMPGAAQNNGGQRQADPAAPPTISGLEGKLQMSEQYLRSLELKAKIKMNEMKQEKLMAEAQADFLDYISTLYANGRLNHVVIAADFYRQVFEEGQYPAELEKKVNAALEANRDVQDAVGVARYKIGRGQLAGATDSLEHAFATNELNVAVLGLERPLKEKISDFNRRLTAMQNQIEARDFTNLETNIRQVTAEASDFDAVKPMAIVNAVKLESKMRLGKAKLLAQQGNLEQAMQEFKAAAEAWPANPALESGAEVFFQSQDTKTQILTEFDRLVAEQNYRALFDKQIAFAPAVNGDAKREEQLKGALLAIKDAEIASEKANMMMMAGDFSGAWETVELASKVLRDDKKLNSMRADLASRSADFVSSINKARDAETRSDSGYSLTWYVNAQRTYPASKIANDGIKRLSHKLLETSL